MFPIRDHNPSRRFPFVTYALIAINVIVYFAFTVTLDVETQDLFYRTWGMQPSEIQSGEFLHTMITCTFLHGGFMHLLGNMLFLYIFGDNMEDTLGSLYYLLFYFSAGIAAGVAHIYSAPGSTVPTIGASGAVAGVMGGYLLTFPKARVDILIFLGVIIRVFTWPAWVMLGGWFAMEFYRGSAGGESGVAHWAHTGGLAFGAVMMFPVWLMNGGTKLWRMQEYKPPHPPAEELTVLGRPFPVEAEKGPKA